MARRAWRVIPTLLSSWPILSRNSAYLRLSSQAASRGKSDGRHLRDTISALPWRACVEDKWRGELYMRRECPAGARCAHRHARRRARRRWRRRRWRGEKYKWRARLFAALGYAGWRRAVIEAKSQRRIVKMKVKRGFIIVAPSAASSTKIW